MSTKASTRGPTIFLHVGAPKTGTTFIQEVLWAHHDKLARDGILLPGNRRVDHYRATLDVREVRLDRHPGVPPRSWQRLVDEALAWDGTVIISHEMFAGATERQARRAVESLHPAEIHIVYTARDLGRQIPAEWQERIKHRRHDDLGEFVNQVVEHGPAARWFWRVQDPADVLRRWGATLPPERLHVVTVPPAGSDPGMLWRRFMHLVGTDPDGYDTTTARSNVSLGLHEVELLRRVNEALGDRLSDPGAYSRFAKDILAHRLLADRPGKTKFGFDPQLWPWVEERSRAIVDDLAATACDVVGDLDELLPIASVPDSVHPRDIDGPSVADAGADAVAKLLTRLRQQTLRAERAERRVADLERQRVAPVKQTLINFGKRHRAVRRARAAYLRTLDVLGGPRLGRRSVRGDG